MATQVSIVNRAFRFLGEAGINEIGQDSNLANIAKDAWEVVLDWCLRCHPWNFSQKWASLARNNENPAFGFSYSYKIPADCLRVIDIRSDGDLSRIGADYNLVGRDIFTNIDPCLCRYVYRNTDPTYWPADFSEFVTIKLALDIVPTSVPAETNIKKELEQRLYIAMDIARKADNAENRAVKIDQRYGSRTLQARWKGVGDGWD